VLPSRGSCSTPDRGLARRLALVIAGNGMLRVAGGASAVLVALYVADLSGRGFGVGAGFVGTLAAMAYGAELLGAVPMGTLADGVSARVLMTGGALLAALATFFFGVTDERGVFFVSRGLEGLAAAAGVPALLAHLTDATAGDHRLRARAMSYFELSLMAGLALGGIVGGQLWSVLGTGAFTALAVLYVAAALLLFIGSAGSRDYHARHAWQGLRHSLDMPALRRLAPIWLCMNAILGLWLGPTLYFLLTHRSNKSQVLVGVFAGNPVGLGWLLFAYSIVFGTGVLAWSRVLSRIDLRRALRISLFAMVGVAVGLLVLNHMAEQPLSLRWMLTAIIAALVMVESGFPPAALSLLAGSVGPAAGRGAAMGIYSFLLSVGGLGGSLLAGLAGRWLAIDGLTYATLVLALVALALLPRLGSASVPAQEID
jgi:MFS family permease